MPGGLRQEPGACGGTWGLQHSRAENKCVQRGTHWPAEQLPFMCRPGSQGRAPAQHEVLQCQGLSHPKEQLALPLWSLGVCSGKRDKPLRGQWDWAKV